MGLRDLLADVLGYVRGAPAPSSGLPPATPTQQEPLTTATVASIRAMLDEHDRGIFLRSALLADLIRRNANAFGALQQRVNAVASIPMEVHPADESDGARAEADVIRAAWPQVVSEPARTDFALDSCLLGWAVGQLVWNPGAEGALWPRLTPWPASAVERDRASGRWYALTLDQGRQLITPGDDRWVFFAPRSERAPELWGAIRCTAEWYIRDADAASDGSRHAEVHGQPIWKAFLPAGARETPDGRSFARSLRTMGRAAVIPVPRGRTEEESYDVELVEAKADAYRIFEFLMLRAGGSFRLAFLGQDLTSQNNVVGTNASSTTGLTVLDRLVTAECRALSECFTAQIATPLARYRGRPAVRICLDAEPDEDWAKRATTMTAAAGAVKAWRDQGVNVDAPALAREAGVPVLPEAQPPKRGELYAYHLQYQLLTVNEARAWLGLDPVTGGDTKPVAADVPPTSPDGAS